MLAAPAPYIRHVVAWQGRGCSRERIRQRPRQRQWANIATRTLSVPFGLRSRNQAGVPTEIVRSKSNVGSASPIAIKKRSRRSSLDVFIHGVISGLEPCSGFRESVLQEIHARSASWDLAIMESCNVALCRRQFPSHCCSAPTRLSKR